MIKLNNKIIDFKSYNDGTTRVNIPIPQSKNAIIIWLFDKNEEIISIFYLISHLKTYKCYVKLIVPYLPNSRQDKVKTEEDVFTLKYFCNLLNSLKIDEIETFDVHSSVSPALLNNLTVKSPQALIERILNENKNLLLAYCDEGGFKRYYNMFNVPYVFGCKIRNYETQKIEYLQILGNKHLLAGRDILIVDDIISRGSTTRMMYIQLKESGAKNIYIYASHVEPTVLEYGLLDAPDLKKVYTTNSIWRNVEHPKVEIIQEFE